MKPAATPKPSKGGRGGARPGSGRKPQWPPGTTLKSMRLPASLEDELRQYAHKRLAEIQRAQAKTAARKAAGFPSSPAGPPPQIKYVRMDKIDTRHYRIVHQERTIGHVSRRSDGLWSAWFSGTDDDNLNDVEGPTRRIAVSTLLNGERARWHHDGLGGLYRDDSEA